MNDSPSILTLLSRMHWRAEFSMLCGAAALVATGWFCILMAEQWLRWKQRREEAGTISSREVFEAQIFYNRVRSSFAFFLLLAAAIVIFTIAKFQDPPPAARPTYQDD
jgi:hypothetical protein